MVYLANFLAKNGGKHTVGAGLTIADLCLWEILDLHLRIFEDAIKKEVGKRRKLDGAVGTCRRPKLSHRVQPRAYVALEVADFLAVEALCQTSHGVPCPPSLCPSLSPAVPRAGCVPRPHRLAARHQGIPGLTQAPGRSQRQHPGLKHSGAVQF